MKYKLLVLYESDTYEVSVLGNTITRVVKHIGETGIRREIPYDRLNAVVKGIILNDIAKHELTYDNE